MSRSGSSISTISAICCSGDFGPSYNLPDFTVAELFRVGLPVSIQLGATALILALLVGGVLGIIAALNQNQRRRLCRHRHRDRRQHHPDLRHRAALPARSSR